MNTPSFYQEIYFFSHLSKYESLGTALEKRHYHGPPWEGSLSLEAALVLPLFLFACFCLMMPMRMMDRQRQIQAVLEGVGEDISQYAYAVRCLEGENAASVDVSRGAGEEAADNGGWDMGEGIYALSEAYAAGAILSRINQEWVEDVSFQGTEIGPDDMVHIVMHYRMRLPFSVLGLDSLPFESVCSRRMWTGAVGNRWEKEGWENGQEEEIVYIGKTSTRYHRQRSCHYLSNVLKPAAAADIEDLRNQEGKRYHACQTCGGGSGTVYISDYGTSYHASPDCGLSSPMSRRFPFPRWKPWGRVLTAEEVKLSDGGGRNENGSDASVCISRVYGECRLAGYKKKEYFTDNLPVGRHFGSGSAPVAGGRNGRRGHLP